MKISRLFLIASLTFLLVLPGCDDDQDNDAKNSHDFGGNTRSTLTLGKAAITSEAMSPQSDGNNSMALDRSRFGDRKIAETHHMTVEIDANSLYARLKADIATCGELKCEIVNSSYNKNVAQLSARLQPEDLPKFLTTVEHGKGELTSHDVSADDRTSEYVDVSARLQNKEALRNRLKQMLETRPNASLSDVLQVEREIARVQEELDQTTGQMHRLESNTNKARVNIQYQVPIYARAVNYAALKGSFASSWRGFINSLGQMTEFVGSALPWIPVILLGLWLFIRIIRAAFTSKGRGILFWRNKRDTPPL
jgi:hypothetical protein